MKLLPEESYSTVPEQKLPLRMTRHQKVICGTYLLLVAGAEVSTIYNPTFGIAFHVAILFSLLTSSVLVKDPVFSGVLLAFAIVPLIRILSLSMPLIHFAYIMWFLLISIPIFIAIFVCMIIQRLSLKDVRMTFAKAKDLPIEVGIVLLALPTGILEYYLLTPEPLLYELEPALLIAPVLIIVLYTGFVEELAFRGLMQYHAVKMMGWWGILFITTTFAVMHIGNLNYWDVLLAFALGGVYALVVRKTGSIYGVTLSHGLVNVILFLIGPVYLA